MSGFLCIALFLSFCSKTPEKERQFIPQYQENCSTLHVHHLLRAEIFDKRNHDVGNWLVGHYPYKMCPMISSPRRTLDTNARAAAPVVVVTVMDRSYSGILPLWAAQVHKAGASCFVVAIDADVCSMATLESCECLGPDPAHEREESRPVITAATRGWHRNREESVKRRFVGALKVLASGRAVFMHDADVLFPSGVKQFIDYGASLWRSEQMVDLMVQDNGNRDTAYDGLNWGFVWLNPTPFTRALLNCTVKKWEDAAFGCPKKGLCNSYYKRSQPRINHILELSLKLRGTIPICKLPSLSTFGAIHMTGYPNAAAKLACARASGFLIEVLATRLSYTVPSHASLVEQRLALQAAIVFANSSGVKLEIPKSYYNQSVVGICDVFDLSNTGHFLTAPTMQTCDIFISSVEGVKIQRGKNTLYCLDYGILLKMGTTSQVFNNSPAQLKIPICDPRDPQYESFHSCYRHDGTDDEILLQ
jgi:hypothetical protein